MFLSTGALPWGRLPDRPRARLAGHTMCIAFVTVGELENRLGATIWNHVDTHLDLHLPRPNGKPLTVREY